VFCVRPEDRLQTAEKLSNSLNKRGITGIMPGVTKQWKFNTYGLTKTLVGYLADSFIGIAEEKSMVVGVNLFFIW